jgi:N-formylglutamate deformylase
VPRGSTPWSLVSAPGPLVAVALHSGHEVRDDVRELLVLDEAQRLHEEDPYTRLWTALAPTRVVAHRSRFELDLNRPREGAIYETPDAAWGLEVWKHPLPDAVKAQSLALYDAFYAMMHDLLGKKAEEEGRFVVFDLHSYNHRRGGPDAPPDDPELNPDINLGTGSMPRDRWAPLVERFMETLSGLNVLGRPLDVRENVRFRGGHFTRWVHTTFPESGCALAIEVKKFFMDEWSGRGNAGLIGAVGEALAATVQPVLAELERLAPVYR